MYYKRFIPRWTKQQFVTWAVNRHPGSKPVKFNKMRKKQLIAIYCNS